MGSLSLSPYIFYPLIFIASECPAVDSFSCKPKRNKRIIFKIKRSIDKIGAFDAWTTLSSISG